MERCNPSPDCPLWPVCVEDNHHTYHPKAILRRMGAMAFRNAHVERSVCRAEHDRLHETEATNLPSREQIKEWEEQERQFKAVREQGL